MVLNSVMVGLFTAVTQLLDRDAVARAVADSISPSLRDLNLKAFSKGLDYGLSRAATVVEGEFEDVAYLED